MVDQALVERVDVGLGRRQRHDLGSQANETTERRRQATYPPRTIPELVADEPNRVWSYDVTKLKGPVGACTTTCS